MKFIVLFFFLCFICNLWGCTYLIEPFAQGIMKPMQMCIFIFFCFIRVCVVLKKNAPRMSPKNQQGCISWPFTSELELSDCVLSLVQYLGFCMLRNAAWLQGLLLRYGCRASSDGPASSTVCSQCPPVFACDDVQVVLFKTLSNISGSLLFVGVYKNKGCLLYPVWNQFVSHLN